MSNNNIEFFRSTDPIENFKLKISIREVKRSQESRSNINKSKHNRYQEERVFSWQEKVNGPNDICKAIKTQSNDSKERSNEDISKSLSDIMLYTYTDKDQYKPPVESCMYDSLGRISNTESYVGSAASNAGSKVFDDSLISDARQKKLEQRIFRDKPFKIMHICLATDVDVDTLKNKNPFDPRYYYNENILCSVKIYSDGLIEINPGFSKYIDETQESDRKVDGLSATVFLNNKTVNSGIKEGFRLSSHRVLNSLGSEYLFTLQNLNDLLLPQKIEEIRQLNMISDKQASQRSRGNASSDSKKWMQDPPSIKHDIILAFYGEIVSATGFYGEQLFVNYKTIIPTEGGWEERNGNLCDNFAEQNVSDKIKEIDGFHESYGTALSGTTQISIAREDNRGLVNIIYRKFWKGCTVSPTFENGTSLILSLSFFVLTVFSLLLGLSYPFWLIPAFVIFFIVGSGFPGGITQVLLKDKNGNNSNSRFPHKTLAGPHISSPTANFNHLFSYSFDVKDVNNDEKSIDKNKNDEYSAHKISDPKATILFQVYSVGFMGRKSLEGYGYTYVPKTAGSVDVEIKTWRPVGGVESKMKDHFLGNSMRLRDSNFVEIPNKNNSAINKFGLQSESSGTIRFRCQTIITDPRIAKLKSDNIATALANHNDTSVRRTVDDILSSFKSSTGISGRSLISPSNSMLSLNKSLNLDASVKSDKLTEILARARAKSNALKTTTSNLIPKSTEGLTNRKSSLKDKSSIIISSLSQSVETPVSKGLNALSALKLPNSNKVKGKGMSRYENVSQSAEYDSGDGEDAHEKDSLLLRR